jgi:hypothetical protein
VFVRRSLVALLVCLAVLAFASCEGEEAPPAGAAPQGPVTQSEADSTIAGLCEMLELGRHDRDGVNDAFFDESHASLHRIAAEAQSDDRAATGLLLERKQLVENDLLSDPIPKTFDDDIQALVDATGGALQELDLNAPDCDD